MSTLRIKLPAQKLPPSSAQEPMEGQPTKRQRKVPKRYQQSPDGEERAAVYESASKLSMSRTATSSKPRRQSTAESVPASIVDTEIDVMNEVDEERPEAEGLHSEYSPKPRTTISVPDSAKASKPIVKSPPDAPPPRKKPRKVVVSESEEDEYVEASRDAIPEPKEDEGEDDYYSPEEKSNGKASKGKGKAASGKANAVAKSTKRKAKLDPDEFQPPHADRKGAANASTLPKKRLKPSAKAEEPIIDVVGDATGTPDLLPSSPIPAKQDSPAAVVPKKTKLPTIKKTKLPGTSGLNTPTASAPAKKPPLEIGPSNKDGSRKSLMAGNTDIDLSNKSIYQELFSKTGGVDGATPRRAKEEERRKELNRMRDEARAKRASEVIHFFDLQAQFDKISCFEDQLRAERSSALYPNFLAAKWREVYERERRRPKDQEWNDAAEAANAKEEGEVG